MAGKKKTEWRVSKHGWPMRALAIADGYAMVRHKGCMPSVISESDWLAAPLCDHKGLPA
jgi:hypothetical protein